MRFNNNEKIKSRKSVLTKAATAALAVVLTAGALAGCGIGKAADDVDYSKPVEITNVSYDPTRELYVSYNELLQSTGKSFMDRM